MSKTPKTAVNVKGTLVTVMEHQDQDYISLTDIARHKERDRTDHVIQNWMRNRNTIEFLGIWESLNNSHFKPLEFEGFRKRAGRQNAHPKFAGNMHDYATIEQLEG